MIILFRSLENVSSFTSTKSGEVSPELKMEAVVIYFGLKALKNKHLDVKELLKKIL